MSELSKLQKHLHEVATQVEEFSSLDNPSDDQDKKLLSTAALLLEGGTRDRCEAFRRKLADKDPVTGDPRFGPSTTAKIQAMLTLHADLSSTIEPLAEAARLRNSSRQQDSNQQQMKDSDKAAAERILQLRKYTHHPAPPPMVPLNIFRPDLLNSSVLDSEQESQEQQSEAEKKRLLREKAESVRTRKRTQAELETMARVQENTRMRNVADMLNIPISPKGEGGALRKCLHALKEAALATEAQQLEEFGMVVEAGDEVLRVALGCVRSVLGNIHQYPDDEKLRRIRINHPMIRERLTKLGVSAIRLLVAVGFRARAVTAQGNPIPEEEGVEGGAEESKGNTEADLKLDEEVAKALAADGTHNTCRLTLLLIMTEPMTETSAGREAWKVWFDGLQTTVDALTEFSNES